MTKIIDRILLILAVIALIASVIGAVYVTADVTGSADEREAIAETVSETITWTVGTAVINRRFTRPDNYELLYRTTYENGLSIDRWVAVTREEYFNVGRDSLE